MDAFIAPPQHTAWYLRIGIWFAERAAHKRLLPARLLAWYPRAAVSSAVLESLIAHDEGAVDARLLKLVRMQVSFAVACPFCIGMNSAEYAAMGIADKVVEAMRGRADLDAVDSLSARDKAALRYVRLISETPLKVTPEAAAQVRAHFSEREMVVLATTAAQVNYWARLIQGLGIPEWEN